jgi:predicted transcriptional regulator
MNYAKQMQAVVDAFVDQVTELALRAALESISSSMGVSFPSAFMSNGASRVCAKRGAYAMDQMKERILRLITDNPGKRSEEINATLGTTTKDLALPLRQLVADKQITTKGQRRGMRYFASGRKTAKA